MNRALTMEKTGPVSLVRTMDVILVYSIQVSFFGKVPDAISIIGGSLIFICAIFVTIDRIFLLSYEFFNRYKIQRK